MSHKPLPFKRPHITHSASTKHQDQVLQLLNIKDLSSIEMDIISKINLIINELKDLEDNFCKMRQDLLKKTTIEGRENSKICAVQGNVISNKKKYYKNLEEEIESLSKAFQEQFKKINKEINSISQLSKSKIDSKDGSSGVTPLSVSNYGLKYSDLPTIKFTKGFDFKSSLTLKDKFSVPFTLRAEPLQEEIPKTLHVERTEVLQRKRTHTASNPLLRSAVRQTAQVEYLNESTHINLNAIVPREISIDQVSSDIEIDKDDSYQGREDVLLFKESVSAGPSRGQLHESSFISLSKAQEEFALGEEAGFKF